MLKNKHDYLFTITNIDKETTFGVPVSIEELTKIIKGLPLLDKREGSFYEGNIGVIEEYFGVLNSNE